MTSPEHRPLGPSTPTAQGPAPFSISAPTELTLAADRSGTTTFTVTNLTGRPVRARLLPKGVGATDQAWLSVVGEAERPLAVAGTLSVDMTVTVLPTTAAGTYTARLDVAAEDATETVAGQTVSFKVPEPEKPKGAPVWLFILIAVVALALIAGGLYFFVLRSDKPKNTAVATVSGTSAVGQVLTATPGKWSGAAKQSFQWQRCVAANSCADIAGATATTYTPVDADVEKSIRVDELAFGVDPAKDSAKAAKSKADEPSAQIGPVLQKNVTVPNVVGQPLSVASKALIDAGLLPAPIDSPIFGPFPNPCDPNVLSQNPTGGSLKAGTPVALSHPVIPSTCVARQYNPGWINGYDLGRLVATPSAGP
jgi:PASTA domain